jgi:UDP-N-acetyl-D-mannosaminuronic acid dehydrogenase
MKSFDICVIGGCGHVGLPLSIQLANYGNNVCIYDTNKESVKLVKNGIMPFMEEGAEPILKSVLKKIKLQLFNDAKVITQSEVILLIVGTPVDEFLNPRITDLLKLVSQYLQYMTDKQLLILRSTVYPGISRKIYNMIQESGKDIDVAFCPERIAEGHAIKELVELPQIVSSFTERGLKKAKQVFLTLTKDIVELEPEEAELAKLFTNAWRYIKFATANQFFIIANDYNLNYLKIYNAMIHNYPRAKDFPSPGFAGGPCLLKDTMQLSAFNNNNFMLGHTAMLVNEGLPNYIVQHLGKRYELGKLKIGILGMAFKANSDDKRSSLSYKLRKILQFKCSKIYCSDPFIKEEDFIDENKLIALSDLIILGVPHSQYRGLDLKDKPVVDIWDFFKGGFVI